MIIRYLHDVRVSLAPSETYPPLIVNANAILSRTPSRQLFEPIARRNTQVFQSVGSIQNSKFSPSQAVQMRRKPARELSGKDALSFFIAETFDHKSMITQCALTVKRYYWYFRLNITYSITGD